MVPLVSNYMYEAVDTLHPEAAQKLAVAYALRGFSMPACAENLLTA
jgi:hypothetical protein